MKYIISFICLAAFGVNSMAQDRLTIHKKDGTKEVVLVNDFNNASFITGNAANPTMIIRKSDNTQLSLPLSNFNFTSFDEVPYRYGNQFLSAQEKEITEFIMYCLQHYEHIGTNFTNHKAFIDFKSAGLPNITRTKLQEYLSRMLADYPQTFHIFNIPRDDDPSGILYARVYAVFTPEKYAASMATIDSLVNVMTADFTSTMSDYEKVLKLHDRFLSHAHYGGMNDGNGGNMYGAFIDKAAVCEGLSRGFLYLCQKTELKCIYICGSAYGGTTTGASGLPEEQLGAHAWNFVEVDGKWYLVDLTPDICFGTMNHSAFLRGKTYFDQKYRLYYTDGSNQNHYYPSLPTLADDDYPCAR